MLSQNISPTSKTTLSKNTNTYRYEAGPVFAETRLVRSLTETKERNDSIAAGYNGTPVLDTVYDFTAKFPMMKFVEHDLLAEQIVVDARTLPSIPAVNAIVSEYFEQHLKINLVNIYINAPAFFEKHFISDPLGFELYQKYYYLISFIKCMSEKLTDSVFQTTYKLTEINSWIASRRDPNIDYILVGPTENTVFDINFEEHYNALISSSTSMADIVRYQQLTTSQTTSNDVLNILSFLQTNPNTYYKNPDEAKKYTLNIDSSRDVIIDVDKDNNLLFDCGYVNFGDTTEQNLAAHINDIDTVQPPSGAMDSRIATKKIERIFQQYSRVKILECVVSPDAFITSLDIFPKVFIVFQGVLCSERNIYNTIENNYFKIGGSFVRTARGYEFKQDVDAITYKSSRTRVSAFKIYISVDPNTKNLIMPNEFPIKFTKFNVFQHPIMVNDNVNDNKLNMVRIPHPPTVLVERQYVKPSTNPAHALPPGMKGRINSAVYKSVETSGSSEIAYIDTDTGTINGQYFRLVDGMVTFTDPTSNKAYTTPDPECVKYNGTRNDICLINLYNYTNETIVPIPYGTFMFSENLKTIENLSYVMTRWNAVNLNFRYDSRFNMFLGNQKYNIIPDCENKDPTCITWSELKDQTLSLANVEYFKLVNQANDITYFSVDRDMEIYTKLKPTDTITINGTKYVVHQVFTNSKCPSDMTFKKLVKPLNASPYYATYTVYRLSSTNIFKNRALKAYYNYYQTEDYYMYDTSNWNVKLIKSPSRARTYIKDAFGNEMTFVYTGDRNESTVVNSHFDTFETLTKVTITNYDAENNKITLTYFKYMISDTMKYVIVINDKYVTSQGANVLDMIICNLGNGNVYRTAIQTVVNKVINLISSVSSGETLITNTNEAHLCIYEMDKFVANSATRNSDGVYIVTTYHDPEFMTKFIQLADEVDTESSNYSKAFNVKTFDPKSHYWTKSLYANSILHTHIPIRRPYHYLPTNEMTFTSTDDGFTIYKLNTHDEVELLTGTYTVNDEGIFEQLYNGSRKLDRNESIYVSQKKVNAYFYVPDTNDINELANVISTADDGEYIFEIRDFDYDTKYHLSICVTDGRMSMIKLCETGLIYLSTGSVCRELIPIGTYSEGISSDIPLYIAGNEIILNFAVNTVKNNVTINSISMSNVVDKTYEYRTVDRTVMRRYVDTFAYSNKTERLIEKDLFTLSVPMGGYAIHPYVKYVENSFELPKRVNKYNEYITIINKTNQNLTTGIVNMYNNYETNKSTSHNNLSVGKRIGSTDEYIMESMDANMILIGNMFKSATFDDVAIRNDDIYVVPKASKMTLTLEFT